MTVVRYVPYNPCVYLNEYNVVPTQEEISYFAIPQDFLKTSKDPQIYSHTPSMYAHGDFQQKAAHTRLSASSGLTVLYTLCAQNPTRTPRRENSFNVDHCEHCTETTIQAFQKHFHTHTNANTIIRSVCPKNKRPRSTSAEIGMCAEEKIGSDSSSKAKVSREPAVNLSEQSTTEQSPSVTQKPGGTAYECCPLDLTAQNALSWYAIGSTAVAGLSAGVLLGLLLSRRPMN